MENILEALPSGSRVLVIRLRSLGDCVLTTPALAILKQVRPDVEIGVVVEDRFAAVFENNPVVDRVLPPSLKEVARMRPHLSINFHGGPRSTALAAASRARYRAGFGHFRASALYNIKIPRAQEILGDERVVHTAEHLASAMFYLGAPIQEIPRAQLAADPHTPSKPYAVFHPVASALDKTWPAENFLRMAAHVDSTFDLEPVFIAAAGEDLTGFEGFRLLEGAPLGEVKNLIAGASLFVGNDSGPAHMAAAFGLPVAVVFGNSDPRLWGPWKTAADVLASPDGIGAIKPEQMSAALDRLGVKA